MGQGWLKAVVARVVLAAIVVSAVVAAVAGPDVAGAAGAPVVTGSGGRPHARASTDWLGEVNYYRAAAGLGPVADNPSWDAGIANHLTYLALTPPGDYSGAYQSVHTENPASPYYTPSGATEAAASDLFIGGVGNTPLQFVDAWLTSPFHAIGMLRPGLRQVAFASNPTTGDAGLDVLSGLDQSVPQTGPVLFPGPGAVTTLSTVDGNEVPDPLQTCGSAYQGTPAGLPLIALLTSAPSPGLSATLAGPAGTESSAAGSLCVVDENDYVSTDPVEGPTGMAILRAGHAVLLIPRSPLAPGTYVATVTQPGAPAIQWSFAEAPPPVVDIAATADGKGYWLVNALGRVSEHGDAPAYGQVSSPLNAPIDHMVTTPDGKGYWLVASDGGVFAFGDAPFYGSMGGHPLNAPVVDVAPTPDGRGYWLVASDGGVFAFGDAPFYGSMGGHPLNRAVTGITATATGYWLVASDGGIFAFGAPFYGSTGGVVLNQPIVGMARTDDGRGYWLVAGDGGVFSFGDAGFEGSMGGRPLNAPVAGIAADPTTPGYWLVGGDGAVYAFGAPFYGTG